jgi:hypothetical protein
MTRGQNQIGNRIFFGCLLLALAWWGRDGVRQIVAAVEKSQAVHAGNPNEANTK